MSFLCINEGKMKFGIYSNLSRDIDGRSAITLARYLEERNIEFAFSKELAKTAYACAYLPDDELAKTSDVMVIFGGDGTVLHFAKICARHDTPVFAVNVGRVGFLTESENTCLDCCIDQILSGDYKLENRTLLNIEVGDMNIDALNECVISRGSDLSLMDFEYSINNFHTEKLRSDALIVATPTGSTAYSLSCGGSIVTPDVRCILITPVNAYTLNSRPLIVSDDSIIEVAVKNNRPAKISIDGEENLELTAGGKVIISKSDIFARFIRFDEGSFYKKLQKKVKITE